LYDATLNLIPSTNLTTAVVTGTGKALGKNRAFNAVARIAGDVTGTTPALALTIEQSATLGGTYAAIAGPLALVELATVQGTTPRVEIPLQTLVPTTGAGPVQGTAGTPNPQRLTFTTTLDFVRAVLTPSGTGTAFPLTSVVVEPIDAPVLMSGR
jgi:hypothetical protein